MAVNKVVGISRIDSKNTHGWFVRKNYQGQTYSRFFSDNRYHSKEKAFQAAREYRRKLDEKYPPPASTAFRTKPQKNSKTGVVGVSETHMRSRNGKLTPCFTVTWRPEKGKSKTKKFSIPAYGREEAFRLAVEFRREKEEEMLKDRGKH